jgi:hypothetical protein
MNKTMSVRMDRENFEFLNEFTKEQRSEFSKVVRDMVARGRILLAVEQYKGRSISWQSCRARWRPPWSDDDDLDGIRSGKQDRRGGLSPRTRRSPKGVVTTGATGLRQASFGDSASGKLIRKAAAVAAACWPLS